MASRFPQFLSLLRSQSQKLVFSASSAGSFRMVLLFPAVQPMSFSVWLRGLQSHSSRLPLDRWLLSSLSPDILLLSQCTADFFSCMLPGCPVPMEQSTQQARHVPQPRTTRRCLSEVMVKSVRNRSCLSRSVLIDQAPPGARADVLSWGPFFTDCPAETNWTSCFCLDLSLLFAWTLMLSVCSASFLKTWSCRHLYRPWAMAFWQPQRM